MLTDTVLCLMGILVLGEARMTLSGDIRRADITCWTCPPYSSNEDCNRWAPNLACPINNTFCHTEHIVSMATGRSLSVEKSCVKAHHCTLNMIGCTVSDDGQSKRCVSCCAKSLCNEDVPTDHFSAINLSALPETAEATRCHSQLTLKQTIITAIICYLIVTL